MAVDPKARVRGCEIGYTKYQGKVYICKVKIVHIFLYVGHFL